MQRLLLSIAAIVVASTAAGCGVSAIAGSALALSSDKRSSSSTTAPPIITSVSPADGSHAGGTTITITGRSFPPDATVSVGGVAARDVQVIDAQTMTATTPAWSTAGEADVVVASASAGSGTMRHGFVYTNELPSVEITPFGAPQSQNIVVSFTLVDVEGDLIDIRLEVDAGAGFEAIAAEEIVSGDVTLLASSPEGTRHAITFDSRTLFPAQDATGVRLRITPTDRTDGRVGLAGMSTAFVVINNTPVTVEVIEPGRDAFHVVVTYVVADPDSDGVRVSELRWQDLRSGASGPMTVASGQGLGAVSCSAIGARVATVWDSFADLGHGNDRLVMVTVTVDDGFTRASATTQPFYVSNGPLSEALPVSLPGTTEAMAVGDFDGDGRTDLAVSGYAGVAFGVNVGRTFAAATDADVPPPHSPTSPPFSSDPGYNALMGAVPSPGPLAFVDQDGDQRLDLLVGDGLFHPAGLIPLHANAPLALWFASADAPNGYVHVIAHQATLAAAGTTALGRPDVAGGTWESAQAPIAARAPHLFSSGSSLFSTESTGDPTFDNVGWFIQSVTATDLDAPSPAALPNDVVIVHGLFQLGRAYAGDRRGVVMLRQSDPDSGRLGPPVYLDPTDMGQLPTMAVVADVLGPSRAEGAWAALATAPVGTPDIVVACRGDSSLTFYFQVDAAQWPAPAAPRFSSLNLPMSAVNPGTPLGDVSGVAVGDLNGDSLNDLVVAGNLSRTITVLLHDDDPAAPGSLLPLTAGRLPLRRAAVIDLGSLGLGTPSIADVSGDGVNDILVPMTLSTELRLLVGAGMEDGAPQFTAVRVSMPDNVGDILVPDVDGDSRADVVARTILLGVSVSIQTSAGTLDEHFVPIVTGTSPQMLRVADVLGLGSPQVVCPSAGDGTVQVFGRDATTTLRLAAQYSIEAKAGSAAQLYAPIDTLLADVTGDGAPDITTLVRFVADGAVLGAGFGVIASPLAGAGVATVRTTTFGNSVSLGIAGGDLDGDGVSDIVVGAVGASGGGVAVFEGGSTLPQVTSRALPYALGCEVVDVDGDGFADVLVGVGTALNIFYGSPTGLAAAPSTVDAFTFNLVTADLDGDGRLDIVVTDLTREDVQVCYQTAPRTFTVVRLVGGHQCQQPAVGDLDGDGLLDIAVPWAQESVVAVYHQRADSTDPADRFATPVVYPTDSGPMGCAIVDVNGDQRNDVVVSSRGTSTLNVFVQR